MKLGSLFDGIGGFPLAASEYGISAIWASEIEEFPIKVTEKHFPNMRHLGDITKINGAEIEPVDIITFGSPCQNLSIAGNREGLVGEESKLFNSAVRIIREMREATKGKFPRFFVWENVVGAFSSNRGFDFWMVLKETTESEIPMPFSGRLNREKKWSIDWARAGVVRTNKCNIAWRTLNAQYWGVPQHRERIFLVGDFAGKGGEEIFFEPQGMPGNIKEGGETREKNTGTIGDGITTTGAVTAKWANGYGGPAGDECYNLAVVPAVLRMRSGCEGGGKGELISYDRALTLSCGNDQLLFTKYLKNLKARRLTPTECLRLQGFPDYWLDIKGAGDSVKYKAIGNSVAIPCVKHIMESVVRASISIN